MTITNSGMHVVSTSIPKGTLSFSIVEIHLTLKIGWAQVNLYWIINCNIQHHEAISMLSRKREQPNFLIHYMLLHSNWYMCYWNYSIFIFSGQILNKKSWWKPAHCAAQSFLAFLFFSFEIFTFWSVIFKGFSTPCSSSEWIINVGENLC